MKERRDKKARTKTKLKHKSVLAAGAGAGALEPVEENSISTNSTNTGSNYGHVIIPDDLITYALLNLYIYTCM